MSASTPYSQPSSGQVSANTVVICFTAIAIVTVGAIAAIFLASKGQDQSVILARAGIITGFVGILLPQILLLIRQDRVTQVVEAVRSDTNALLNGEGDAKMEAAIHRVLDERKIANHADRAPTPPTS